MPEISRVYEVSIEEAGDYIFTPAGVIIVFRNQKFQVYTESARHNFIRRILNRYNWRKMEDEPAVEQGTSVRMRDITDELNHKIDPDEWSVEAVLEHCYRANPLQLFFLKRHFSSSPSQPNMPPW